jgi:hypothetical protein
MLRVELLMAGRRLSDDTGEIEGKALRPAVENYLK